MVVAGFAAFCDDDGFVPLILVVMSGFNAGCETGSDRFKAAGLTSGIVGGGQDVPACSEPPMPHQVTQK